MDTIAGGATVASISSSKEGCFVRAAALLTIAGSHRGDGIVADMVKYLPAPWIRKKYLLHQEHRRLGRTNCCGLRFSQPGLDVWVFGLATHHAIACERCMREAGLLW